MAVEGSVLIVRHVGWEGPHRIARALADLPRRTVEPLGGEPLPAPATLAGAVIMGGPMSASDTVRYPDLEREKAWIERALFHELPLLGVCLGSQLIADVLGATVARAPSAEIGWAPVTVLEPDDPLVGPLAPQTAVLHWHAEQYHTPPGAKLLARSAQTGCQAFRAGVAWGLLFHLEADRELTDHWLAVDEMAGEAARALGPTYAEDLRSGARAAEPQLLQRSTPALDAFAALVRERRRQLAG